MLLYFLFSFAFRFSSISRSTCIKFPAWKSIKVCYRIIRCNNERSHSLLLVLGPMYSGYMETVTYNGLWFKAHAEPCYTQSHPIMLSSNWYYLESESCSIVSNCLQPYGLYSPWNSPGQNTRVGSLSLLQGIFPTQGSNPGLPHCGQILYQLSHQGSQKILEWVVYLFSSRSSWLRKETGVSCIAGGFFTSWAPGKP